MFQLSTMGCAAFGNLASVIVGVLMGERVEKLAMKLGNRNSSLAGFLVSDFAPTCISSAASSVTLYLIPFLMCRPAAAWVVVNAARARIVQSRQDNRLAHWCDCGVYNRHAAIMLDRSFAGKGQASTPYQLRPRTKILINGRYEATHFPSKRHNK